MIEKYTFSKKRSGVKAFFGDGCADIPPMNPFFRNPLNPKAPIELTPTMLDVSTRSIKVESTSRSADRWAIYKNYIRIGTGTNIGRNVNSNATLHFEKAQAVEINVAARWNLGPKDRLTIGYSDATGFHDLLFWSDATGIQYGRTGSGSIYSPFLFFPDPTSNFHVIFGVRTDPSAATGTGASIDYFTVKGF